MALHPIQDYYAPPHGFQVWTNTFWDKLEHWDDNTLLNSTDVEKAINATRTIYLEIKNCSGTNDRLGKIFDKWVKEIQQ